MRVAIVGLGAMGKRHAGSINRNFPSTSMAFVDPQVEEFASCTKLASVSEVLDWSPDYVVVATKNELHLNSSLGLIEAGIPVLIEKPATESTSSLLSLIEARTQAQSYGWVGFVERFNPTIEVAIKAIEQGAVGEVLALSVNRFSSVDPALWGPDVTLDLMSHDIDLVQFVLGDSISSGILQRKWVNNRSPYASFLGMTSRSISVMLAASWLNPEKKRYMEIVGSEGTLRCDLLASTVVISEPSFGIRNDELTAQFRGLHPVHSRTIGAQGVEPLFLLHHEIRSHILEDLGGRNVRLASFEDALSVHNLIESSSN